jgi:hypothetical protein
MTEENPSPIIHASDGPRLVLADGSVVRLEVYDDHGGYSMVGYSQGAAMFGRDVDRIDAKIAHVDDPDAEEIEAVEEVLEAYGFD